MSIFNKLKKKDYLKIFFATDIHGSDRCWRKFINGAKFYDAKILILGGDISGKVVVPIIDLGSDLFRAKIHHQNVEVTKKELPTIFKEIRGNGFYYYLATQDEIDNINKDQIAKEEMFRKVIKNSLSEWFELAEERLKGTGVQVYVSPGNDDDQHVVEALEEGPFIVNPDETVREIEDNIWMLSFGWSNRTPWDSPRELNDEEISKRLRILAESVPSMENAIFNVHVPPYNTVLDKAPKLTKDYKPIVEVGEIQMENVGSPAVRASILECQPLLGLHGHIHESAGIIKLGRTTCINPGSEYSDGTLKGALVTLTNGSLRSQLIAG